MLCQVLVLGAGFDTAWFQLQQDLPPSEMPVKYLEVDFKEVGMGLAGVLNESEGPRWSEGVTDRFSEGV